MNARDTLPAAFKAGAVPAVVLSCQGAPDGDLNVVRSLGEQGVPVIVLSEYAGAPAASSRHCDENLVVEGFTKNTARLLDALSALHRRLGVRPVVFASADPDLNALIELAESIDAVSIGSVVDPALSAILTDKQRFHVLAHSHGLPVPRTVALSGLTLQEAASHVERELQFPIILKPSQPTAWHGPGIPTELSDAKAVPIADRAALAQILRELGAGLGQTLVQELVPGDDEAHYDVHAYVGRDGRVQARYCGRKWRIYPPHAGSGCYVESVEHEALETLAVQILQRIGYRGIANMNFKRHAVTGEFKLLEINPRVSQWNILATRSGVNLAWLAYCDALGWQAPVLPARRVGIFYVNGRADARAFRIYRREGLWSWPSYLRSWLRRPLVQQLWQLRDLGPAWSVARRSVTRRLRFLSR